MAVRREGAPREPAMTHAPLTFRLLLTSILSLAAAQANAACYTVYHAAGSVVHQANAPPASAAEAGTVPRVAVSC